MDKIGQHKVFLIILNFVASFCWIQFRMKVQINICLNEQMLVLKLWAKSGPKLPEKVSIIGRCCLNLSKILFEMKIGMHMHAFINKSYKLESYCPVFLAQNMSQMDPKYPKMKVF